MSKDIEALIERLISNAEVEWSYHEDNHRYPRDFWHVRVNWLGMSTDWVEYGEQEQRQLPEDVRLAAETEQRDHLRSAIRDALLRSLNQEESRSEESKNG